MDSSKRKVAGVSILQRRKVLRLSDNMQVILSVAPPENFDPTHCDQRALATHGYPRRPDESPELKERWTRLLGKPLMHIEPRFEKRMSRRSARPKVAHAGTSTNWSGVVASAKGTQQFLTIAGRWRVPPVQLPFASKPLQGFIASLWIGIDGLPSADVFQAGVDCDVIGGIPFTPNTQFSNAVWWEWFPADTQYITNFPVSPGDVLTFLLTANSNYQTRIFESASTFGLGDSGTWLISDHNQDDTPDLVFVKTSQTPSGKVEVHIASSTSGYQKRILEVPTTFASGDIGTWLLANNDKGKLPDLVFVKTAGTANGKVEVHIASGASRYQNRILEVETTFAVGDTGTWLLADLDNDQLLDLVFLKTAFTPSGKVEIHVASGASQYRNRILERATTFASGDTGSWLLADYDGDSVPDLIFVKTAGTPSGSVEVHIASGASQYQQRILEVPTTFGLGDAGAWQMADFDGDNIPDLFFIKTAATSTNAVEVHVASGSRGTSGNVVMRNESQSVSTSLEFSAPNPVSLVGDSAEWIVERPSVGNDLVTLPNYGFAEFSEATATDNAGAIFRALKGTAFNMVDPDNSVVSTGFLDTSGNVECVYTGRGSAYEKRALEIPTTFAIGDTGTWLMTDVDGDGIPDLVFVKTGGTPGNRVEVHIASGSSKYQARILEVQTTFATGDTGTWLMADFDKDGIPDLIFIKTTSTPSGMVEIHIASGASQYQNRILEVPTTFAVGDVGTWLMVDYDNDQLPDLIFIKEQGTPSGNVEIHIASGKSKYQQRVLEVPTAFAIGAGSVWQMANFYGDATPALGLILTAATGTNRVEVHVASGSAHYQTRLIETPTTFKLGDTGTYLLIDYDHDEVPDLALIKTAGTPSGKVEVHIASGRAT
jgi:peptidase A4-like protein/VCBS repeat protein